MKKQYSNLTDQPIISICIPTYNRPTFLKELLESIILQLVNPKIKNTFEVIISDDKSTKFDNKMIESFQQKYRFIHYYRNGKNLGSDANIIQSAKYAKGKYIWFMGDDDLLERGAINHLISILLRERPIAAICNLNLASKDGKIIEKNLLDQDSNVLIKTKKELFSFLEKKFFLPFDWYLTCLSNTIVSKKLFDEKTHDVMKYYNSRTNNFLHSGLIYYNTMNGPISIISKSLVRYRSENRSFGPDEKTRKKEYLFFLHKLFENHYKFITETNYANISTKFRLLLFLKIFSRKFQFSIVKLFGFDIKHILIWIYNLPQRFLRSKNK